MRRLCTGLAIAVLILGVSGCRQAAAPAETAAAEELPTLDVTQWTDATELFMEYPTLVAGKEALFAIHLTKMADFTPVTAGHARLEFTPESGGETKALVGPSPWRPGIFRVAEPPPAAGRYRWALVLEAPGLADRHDLGMVTVFPDDASARAASEPGAPEDAAAISYLKEQQWTNTFATAPVEEANIRGSIRVPAVIHPLPGGEAIVAAPAAGRFRADTLLSIGDRVRADQVMGRLEPRLAAGADRATLDAEVSEARVALDGARVEQERAERLLAERAVPARRVEDARRATSVAEARLRAAEARLAQRDETLRTGGGAAAGNAFALRAPIAGRLAKVMATLGASYDEGAPLFRIVRTDRLELEVLVPAADVVTARQTVGVTLEIPGIAEPVTVKPDHIHDSGVIDPTSRALGVQMEIPNVGERLLVGQAATAVLFGRESRRVSTVPSAAVLMEAGRPYVFVQIGGEQFSRRFVEVASRDGDRIGVRSGLKPGDRVVTRGAYEVQLASAASGLPAEGHVH
jgi:RND family efflux transporter MFP subunit